MTDTENLYCSICFNSFNFSDRLPLILNECEHYFCAECISNQFRLNGLITCPFCQKITPATDLSNLTKNYLVIEAIERQRAQTQTHFTKKTQNPYSKLSDGDPDLEDLINRYVNMRIDDDAVSTQNEEQKIDIEKEEDSKSEVQERNPSKLAVHKRVICDGCGIKPLLGTRFKCKVCPDLDYCENCHNILEHQHDFLRLEKPIGGIRVEIHDRVRCDGCGMRPMIGMRHKCSQCPNFDYCEECMETRTHEHPFYRVVDPDVFSFVVHPKVACNGCGCYPIFGVRYKCTECDDYDLCQECMNLGGHHHQFLPVGAY